MTYSFDASGFRRQRVSGSNTTQYRLEGLFETSSSAVITFTSIAALSGDLAHYGGSPTTSTAVTYAYYNDHGDLVAEADSSGGRTGSYTYDPFGGLRTGSTPANSTAERWIAKNDKKLDSLSGLVEMGVRTYDSLLGRFVSPDPVEGGALNSYDYATQDPVNTYDLDGDKAEVLRCDDPRLASYSKDGLTVGVQMTSKGGLTWGVYLTGADVIYTFGTFWTAEARLDRPGRKSLIDRKSQPYPPHGSFRYDLVTKGSRFTLHVVGRYEDAFKIITWEVTLKCRIP